MANYIREHRRGIIGTTLFHLLIIVFFILYKGFSTPLPLPDDEGILVNFGTQETGSGEIEPVKNDIPPPVEETVQPEEIVEEIEEQVEEQMITQETEEAPEVNAAELKKKEEEEKEKKRIEEEKRKEQERLIELEKIKEERKQDSIDRAKIIEQQKRAKEAFDRVAKGLAGDQSDSEGNTQGIGNQGNENGEANADNYTGNSKGEGGISFSLNGRNPLTLPEPEYINQEAGYIVVEVIVDRDGNVVDAIPGKKGTTITDNKLMEAAKKAALIAKFDTKPDAPPRQTGTITYHFVLE